MSKVIVLDTAPLSLLTNPKLPSLTLVAIPWSVDLMAASHRLIVPAIADFELRRELERSGNARSIAALDAFEATAPDRYAKLPPGTAALLETRRGVGYGFRTS